MLWTNKEKKEEEKMSDLIEFYGEECPHCKNMEPLIDKLEKEENVKIEKLEVWHNEENTKLMKELGEGKCQGVPFFFNKKTKKIICGEANYEKLKAWAK